jgi:hypothetical protein
MLTEVESRNISTLNSQREILEKNCSIGARAQKFYLSQKVIKIIFRRNFFIPKNKIAQSRAILLTLIDLICVQFSTKCTLIL